jgi:hypothetical protein
VTAYADTSLCAEAKRELADEGGRAGDIHVRVVCLAPVRENGKLDLATVGANARRATEDSTTVAYLEAPDPKTARFTHPILEAAEIAWISNGSGKAAMERLLRAIRDAGSDSLRGSVREVLQIN